MEDFKSYLRLQVGLSANSIRSYLSDLKLIENSLQKPLLQLTTPQIEAYLDRRLKEGTSRRTLARMVSSLKSYFEYTLRENLRSENPVQGLEVKLGARTLPQNVLTTTEVQALLDAHHSMAPKNTVLFTESLLIRMLYATGLRVSELCQLELSQVDWGKSILRVKGKGGKPRLVPFDSGTHKELHAYVNQVRKVKEGGPSALFLSSWGKPFTRQAVWKILKKHALVAGIEKSISPHSLRHAFATHLLENGMNLRSLQLILGHSDISTTEIYSHLSTTHLREVLEKNHPKGNKSGF